MTIGQSLLPCWGLGAILVGALMFYKISIRPSERMQHLLRQAQSVGTGVSVAFMALICVTWFVSVPLLYYQASREEDKERSGDK